MQTTPTDNERAEVQARYAVAMHLHANRRVGTSAWVILILGAITGYYFENFWLMIVALALCVIAYFVIIQSCVRFVTQKTGMSPDIQAFFSRKYKTDPEFAKDVDKLVGSI